MSLKIQVEPEKSEIILIEDGLENVKSGVILIDQSENAVVSQSEHSTQTDLEIMVEKTSILQPLILFVTMAMCF